MIPKAQHRFCVFLINNQYGQVLPQQCSTITTYFDENCHEDPGRNYFGLLQNCVITLVGVQELGTIFRRLIALFLK